MSRSFDLLGAGLVASLALLTTTACSPGDSDALAAATGGGGSGSSSSSATGGAGGSIPHGDPFDVPIDGVVPAQQKDFFDGDALFDLPLRDADGLGPLYPRASCGACHNNGVRGPGTVTKMAVVLADGFTTSPDQTLLPFGNTVHPQLADGAVTPIEPPADPSVKVTLRIGPPILGRGYLEAVDDSEILRVEAEQAERTDEIHGRANHVVYQSEPNPDQTFNKHQKGDQVIGRFGLKARIATLDEFTADALQGDMGITSPLRPTEFKNPDGLLDDGKPGVDVTADSVNSRSNYVRLTAIPHRLDLDEQGAALFDKALCSVCHAPSLKTRADYPVALLAGLDAPIYTDLLLHDLGDTLADGVVDGTATSREWRTAPLIGLRFNKSFLHDGRAHTVEEAILGHAGDGSQATGSLAIYAALSADDRATLLAFVGAL